jgi:hypothetical protein
MATRLKEYHQRMLEEVYTQNMVVDRGVQIGELVELKTLLSIPSGPVEESIGIRSQLAMFVQYHQF